MKSILLLGFYVYWIGIVANTFFLEDKKPNLDFLQHKIFPNRYKFFTSHMDYHYYEKYTYYYQGKKIKMINSEKYFPIAINRQFPFSNKLYKQYIIYYQQYELIKRYYRSNPQVKEITDRDLENNTQLNAQVVNIEKMAYILAEEEKINHYDSIQVEIYRAPSVRIKEKVENKVIRVYKNSLYAK